MDKEKITQVLLNAMRNAHNCDLENWRDICNEVEVAIACLIDIAKQEAKEEMREETREEKRKNDRLRDD
jgi:hypothetical protein